MGEIEGREFIENQENWVERPRRDEPARLSLNALFKGLSNSEWMELLEKGTLETDDFNGVRAAGMVGTPPLRPGDIFKGLVNLNEVKTEIEIEVKKVLQLGTRMSFINKIKLSLEVIRKKPIASKETKRD